MVEGLLTHWNTWPHIVADGGVITTSHGADVAMSRAVPVRPAAPGLDLTVYDNRQVVISGILESLRIVIGALDDVRPRTPASPDVAVRREGGRTFVGEGRHLEPVFGDSLDVVRSRWGRDLFDRVLADIDDGLAVSVGNRLGPDQQLQFAATLLHLPTRVARRLERYPPEALSIDVIVRPDTSRRDVS